jgi:hypothetical protein
MGSRRKPPGEEVVKARPSGRDLSRDTAPGGPPLSDPGPDPEPAPLRDDGYRYERPTLDDSLAMRLLGGLSAERFPRTITVDQSTNGQLAAHYHAGPRTVPMAASAAPEEPSVLLSCTSVDEAPAAAERGGQTLRMRRLDVHVPVHVELPPTIVIPRRARLPAWLIAVCGLVMLSCVGILLLALTRVRGGGTAQKPTVPPTGTVASAIGVPGDTEMATPVPPVPSSLASAPAPLPVDSATAAMAPPLLPSPPRPPAWSRPRPRATATRPPPHDVEVPASSKLDREE